MFFFFFLLISYVILRLMFLNTCLLHVLVSCVGGVLYLCAPSINQYLSQLVEKLLVMSFNSLWLSVSLPPVFTVVFSKL